VLDSVKLDEIQKRNFTYRAKQLHNDQTKHEAQAANRYWTIILMFQVTKAKYRSRSTDEAIYCKCK